MQTVYKKLGLKVIAFPAGGTGGQMGGWFKKEINSPEDFNGLKMRIPRFGEDILQDSQLFRIQKPISQVFDPDRSADSIKENLDKGTLDAAEWISPHDDMALGLHTAQGIKFYYYPGWWEPSTTFDVQVNEDAWKELGQKSKKYQSIFKAACYQTHLEMLAEYNTKNSIALQKLQTSNIEIRRFNQEIMDAAKSETEKYLEQWASGSNQYQQIFKEVYEEWKEFQFNIRQWSNHSNYTQIYKLPPEF